MTQEGLKILNFPEIKLDENEFKILLTRENGNLVGDLIGDKIIISKNKLFNNKSNDSALSYSNISFSIKKLLIEGNKKPLATHGKYICREECKLFYAESLLKGKNKMIFKKLINSGNKKITFETDNLGEFLKVFNISDRVMLGKARLEGNINKANQLVGVVSFKDFYYRQNNEYLEELSQYTGFKDLKKLNKLNFEHGSAKFIYDQDRIINIKDGIFYGDNLGISADGWLDPSQDDIKIKGFVIPAYKLNNLLGIKDIPIIGRIITGGKKGGEGVISAKYSIRGKLADSKFKVNTLSAAVPNIFRNIGELLSIGSRKKGDGKEIDN